MTILAIDTATPQVSVALASEAGVLASFAAVEGRRHGEVLAPAIATLTDVTGLGLRDGLEAIVVDTGPGLFTGLRVGIATAQALAAGLGVPVAGRSSLDILAHSQRRATGLVAAVVDARRGEVFWALYRTNGEFATALTDPAVASPEELVLALTEHGEDVFAVGDGARRYADRLPAKVGTAVEAYPHAAVLAELASPDVAAGRTTDPAHLAPEYLRQADVRIGWVERPPAPEKAGANG